MRIFLDPRTFAYGDSPYAYGDQFLTCCDLSLSHALNQNFHMRCTMNQNFVNLCLSGMVNRLSAPGQEITARGAATITPIKK